MPPRLTMEARKGEILDAVQRLFADRGFHATTTKHLAEAAGVSEALLFKYFPTKETLYSEMLARVCKHCAEEREQSLKLPPSTTTLAILVHHVVRNLVQDIPGDAARSQRKRQNNRLMLQSLLADGAFARQFLGLLDTSVVDALARCVMAAAKSGDCDAKPASLKEARVRAWSTLHVAVCAMLYRLPQVGVVEYRSARADVVSWMSRFCLRGLGLSEAAIARCYRPESFAVVSQ
ncbi:MAG: helix-turn-helix transcriptional regulator [Planctomycetes bacterium]|nr:helix-turn-helix transcriptional regulator [Planctomycetota bacterium]